VKQIIKRIKDKNDFGEEGLLKFKFETGDNL
jgi:hypothetical protein